MSYTTIFYWSLEPTNSLFSSKLKHDGKEGSSNLNKSFTFFLFSLIWYTDRSVATMRQVLFSPKLINRAGWKFIYFSSPALYLSIFTTVVCSWLLYAIHSASSDIAISVIGAAVSNFTMNYGYWPYFQSSKWEIWFASKYSWFESQTTRFLDGRLVLWVSSPVKLPFLRG